VRAIHCCSRAVTGILRVWNIKFRGGGFSKALVLHVFGHSHDSDQVSLQHDMLANWILSGEESLRGRLADDSHAFGGSAIAFIELAP